MWSWVHSARRSVSRKRHDVGWFVDPHELAVQRLQAIVADKRNGDVPGADRALGEICARINELKARAPLERFAVRDAGRVAFVRPAEIDWIQGARNYADLHVGKAVYPLRLTIAALEARLPENKFLRISRSILVNVDRIQEVRAKSHGDSTVILWDGTTLTASRTHRPQLNRLLES